MVTRLLASELARVWARRLFRWLSLLAVLGVVAAGVLVYVNVDPGEFRFTEMQDYVQGLSFPLVMLGWIVGASAIGAEWPRRTLSALLTWEPRRTRVLIAKLVAACVYAGLLALVVQALFTAVMAPSGSNGTFAGVDSEWWTEYATVCGRIVLVTVLAAAFGFALAAIGKNTGAALGGGLAYLLVAENLIRVFKGEWTDWLLSSNIVWVVEGAELSGFNSRTAEAAALLLAAYAAGLLLLALSLFRRREIV